MAVTRPTVSDDARPWPSAQNQQSHLPSVRHESRPPYVRGHATRWSTACQATQFEVRSRTASVRYASVRPRMSSRNAAPADPVRGRPWKADGHADRTAGTHAVRYAPVDTAI